MGRVRLTTALHRLGSMLAAAMLLASPSQASLISGSFNFTASGFAVIVGSGVPPVDPVTGNVTFSFDNAASFSDVSTGVAATLNLPGTSGPGMIYNKVIDTLRIGDLLNTAGGISTGTNDWSLVIANVSTFPVFVQMDYSESGLSGIFETHAGSLTPAAAPEPATFALIGLGLAGVAVARRRKLSTSCRRAKAGGCCDR